jgi:hypothetical protein
VKNAAETIGKAADGKVLVDLTNTLDEDMGLAIGLTIPELRSSRSCFLGPEW